jgi:hypothetical protein
LSEILYLVQHFDGKIDTQVLSVVWPLGSDRTTSAIYGVTVPVSWRSWAPLRIDVVENNKALVR